MPTESVGIAAVEKEVRHSAKKHWLDYVTVALEVVGLVVLSIYAAYTVGIYYANNTAAVAAAEAADKSASWTRNQAINIFKDQRPRAWIKISDSIHIEAGKPIKPDIQVFNYGKVPAITRTRIRFEAAPGVIEKFRDTLRNHPANFLVPDKVGTWKVLINPLEGKRFPIETPNVVLSREDIAKLTAGTLDVAVYGRIFYTDLNNSAGNERNQEYQSSFCFYVMRDASTFSACTNTYNPDTKYEAYTNWAQ